MASFSKVPCKYQYRIVPHSLNLFDPDLLEIILTRLQTQNLQLRWTNQKLASLLGEKLLK